MTQFSTTKKQRVISSNSVLYKELVRAYLLDGYERAQRLIYQYVNAEESESRLKISDADILTACALDFVATYRMMKSQLPEQEQQDLPSSLRVI